MSSPNNNKKEDDEDDKKRRRESETEQESNKKRNPGGFMNVRRNQPRVQKVRLYLPPHSGNSEYCANLYQDQLALSRLLLP
jgi:hypothetical protein